MFNFRQHEKTLYQVKLPNDLIDEIEAIRPKDKIRLKGAFIEYLLREGIKNYREQQKNK